MGPTDLIRASRQLTLARDLQRVAGQLAAESDASAAPIWELVGEPGPSDWLVERLRNRAMRLESAALETLATFAAALAVFDGQ